MRTPAFLKFIWLKCWIAQLARRRVIVISVFLLILLSIIAWFVYDVEKPAVIQPSSRIAVETVNVQQQTIPVDVNALGSLQADQSVDISPEVDGQIAKIDFHNGEEVKAGHVLFQLDDSIARAQLEAAEAKLRLSKEDLRRNHRLLKHDALSQQALDQAIEQVAQDQASANEKRLLVKKMQLRAPFSGNVTSRQVSVGQYVTVGQTLVTLVNTDDLKVIYNVDQTYLSQLKLGQTVQVRSDALPGETFSGTVSYVSPSIDETTRTVEVHATVPNNAQQLAPGMFVNVSQELSERDNALVVPTQTLVATIAGQKVFVIKNGRAYETPVKIGARTLKYVEITSGLESGDVVVSAGQQKLRDGSQVQIIDTKPSPKVEATA